LTTVLYRLSGEGVGGKDEDLLPRQECRRVQDDVLMHSDLDLEERLPDEFRIRESVDQVPPML